MPSIEAKDALRKVFYGSIRDLIDEFLPYSEKSTVLRGLLFQNACGWFYGGPTDPGNARRLERHRGVRYVTGRGCTSPPRFTLASSCTRRGNW